MGISILDLDSVSGQYGGLGIARPIWKCPCINLYLLMYRPIMPGPTVLRLWVFQHYFSYIVTVSVYIKKLD